MRLHKLLVILAVIAGIEGMSQTPFHYRRSIDGVQSEDWRAIRLPPDIFQHLRPDLGDFRFYRIDGKDSIEVSYVIEVREDELSSNVIELPLINQSTRDKELFLMFERNESQAVNYLDLEFDRQDFFGMVAIEGSDNRQEWFEIVKDQRIVSVKKQDADYTLSTVNFPLTDYRYLRIRIAADVPLVFRRAVFQHHKVVSGHYLPVASSWRSVSDKKTKQTIVDVRFDNLMPCSAIEVKANSSRDYYRPFRIEVVRDSSKTEKGWIKQYETVYQGHLTSFRQNKFEFQWTPARELRLVIADHDNLPLKFTGITAMGPEVRVISQLTPGNNIMVYGAKDLEAPSYELAWFENKIPDSLAYAQLGPSEQIGGAAAGSNALFENKIWLWTIMGLLIGGLGFFTMKMMKSKPA